MCSCLTREKDLKLMKAVEQVEDSGISEDLAITHSLFMYLLWTLVEGDRREKKEVTFECGGISPQEGPVLKPCRMIPHLEQLTDQLACNSSELKFRKWKLLGEKFRKWNQ